MNTKGIKGFSVIELMITLLVAAIILGVAVPSFFALTQNSRVAAMSNMLTASLNLARMESIKRGIPVSVCSSANTAFSACGTAAQWNQGWIVFVDANSDNTINALTDRVKVQEAPLAGSTIAASRDMVTYDASGFVSNGIFTATLSSPGCYANYGRILNVSASGRVSIVPTNCN